jgi:hypothetical protein
LPVLASLIDPLKGDLTLDYREGEQARHSGNLMHKRHMTSLNITDKDIPVLSGKVCINTGL